MLPRPHARRGFTLIELLVVIGILVILAALSYPAVSALSKSGRINQTIAELGGSLEAARQYAVAQNTYVWVAFAVPDPAVPNQIAVAEVASADGTEITIPGTGTPPGPATWGGSISPGGSLVQISKVATFPLTNLAAPGTVTPAKALASTGTSLASNASFSVPIPGRSAATTFSQALEFTPTGEARVVTGVPVSLVEFDIQPYKGPGVIDAHNGAVIQIDGLTGAVIISRQ